MTRPAYYRQNPELKLFYNDYDYVIALRAEDVPALIAIHFGEGTPESIRAEEPGVWAEVPADAKILIHLIGGERTRVAGPGCSNVASVSAFKLCELFGVGYLASTKE